eukprot:jgi/Galph1/3843/GphlegSOOS_G2489.1
MATKPGFLDKCFSDSEFDFLNSSRLKEYLAKTEGSTVDHSNKFSPLQHDSFIVETFANSHRSCSDLQVYLEKDNDICEESYIRTSKPLYELSDTETSIFVPIISKGVEDNQRSDTCQNWESQEANVVNTRKKGRPCKFSANILFKTNNNLVLLNYETGLWKSYKAAEDQQSETCQKWESQDDKIINTGQRGRPCKFNGTALFESNNNVILSNYRKGIWKAYKTQKASRWCHICNRNSVRAHLMPCFNRWYYMCRKSICHYCIERHYLHRSDVLPSILSGGKFFCSHCLGICPPNSQCKTYQRTNMRRHIQNLLDKRQV